MTKLSLPGALTVNIRDPIYDTDKYKYQQIHLNLEALRIKSWIIYFLYFSHRKVITECIWLHRYSQNPSMNPIMIMSTHHLHNSQPCILISMQDAQMTRRQ